MFLSYLRRRNLDLGLDDWLINWLIDWWIITPLWVNLTCVMVNLYTKFEMRALFYPCQRLDKAPKIKMVHWPLPRPLWVFVVIIVVRLSTIFEDSSFSYSKDRKLDTKIINRVDFWVVRVSHVHRQYHRPIVHKTIDFPFTFHSKYIPLLYCCSTLHSKYIPLLYCCRTLVCN